MGHVERIVASIIAAKRKRDLASKAVGDAVALRGEAETELAEAEAHLKEHVDHMSQEGT